MKLKKIDKVDISLKQLIDVDSSTGITRCVDCIGNGMVLMASVSKNVSVRDSFIFKNLSDIVKGTNGVLTSVTNGILTLSIDPNAISAETSLSELSDVAIAGLADNDYLVYNSVSKKWENSQGSFVPTTRHITINGVTQDLSTNRTWTISSGTVTSVTGTGTVSGLTLTGAVTTSGSLTLGGSLTLTSGNVTTALGFTPYNATNPAGYITSSALTNYVTNSSLTSTLTGYVTSGVFNSTISGLSFVYQPILGYTPVTNARIINTSAPLSGGGDLSADRTLSITQANTSTDGYLSLTDWNKFNGKAGLSSPAFTGTPTAPTAAIGTNTTQLATTAFVQTATLNTSISQVGIFGDGGDGSATVTSAISLPDDRFYTDLIIGTGGSINTAGYRIFVSGTLDLTNAGANAIYNNGGDATSTTAGRGGLGVTVSGFYSGGTLQTQNVAWGGMPGAGGASAGANGSTGGSPTALGTFYHSCGGAGGSGGAGSAGNAASGGAGGAGQTASTNTPANFYYRTLHLGASNLNSMLIRYTYQTSSAQTLTATPTVGGRHGGGGGGGGGGTSIGPNGGYAGGGGGIVVLFAKTISVGGSTNAAAISARGGAGGNGVNGGFSAGGGGGGGAGGGGYVYLVCSSISASATFISTGGGTGGNGGNGGASNKQGGTGGTGGNGGRITVINLSTNTITQVDGTTTAGTAGTAGTTPTGGAGGAGATTTYTS